MRAFGLVRGGVSNPGSAVAWTPSGLSAGVDYWLAEDLAAAGDGGTVTGNWTGRQLGSVLAPYASDMGIYRAAAFNGSGALVTAGLEQTNKAAKCTDSAITTVFNGVNKSWIVWALVQVNSSTTSYYWAVGDLVSVSEYVQARYLGTGTIKNQVALRDGVLNVVDSMTEYQTLAPQLLEWARASSIVTITKDGIAEGSTPTRNDSSGSGISVGQFVVGGTAAGSGAATSAQTVSAIGIATSFSGADAANLRNWAALRLGMAYKKGLVP